MKDESANLWLLCCTRKHFPRYLAGGSGKEEAAGASCSGQHERDCSLLTHKSTAGTVPFRMQDESANKWLLCCTRKHFPRYRYLAGGSGQEGALGDSCGGQQEKDCSLLTYRSITPVLYLSECRMSQQISGCSAVHANISPGTWQEEAGRRKLQEPLVAVSTK